MTRHDVLGEEGNRRVIQAALERHGWGLSEDQKTEVVQTAVARSLRTFDPTRRQRLTTQLFRFVRWDCKNKRRHIARHGGVHLSLSEIAEPASPVSDRQDDIDHLRECMGMLDETDRDLISRYYLEEMSLREIAAVSGCSHESVRKRLGRAMGRLRALCYRDDD